jgi:hypothetical protein
MLKKMITYNIATLHLRIEDKTITMMKRNIFKEESMITSEITEDLPEVSLMSEMITLLLLMVMIKLLICLLIIKSVLENLPKPVILFKLMVLFITKMVQEPSKTAHQLVE